MTVSPFPFAPDVPRREPLPASAILSLRALDACLVEIGDSRIGPDAELLFAMLLYLAMERGKRIPRERVSGILWPGAADENARHCLRQTLYKIRQLGVPVEASGAHLHLRADAVVRDFDVLFSPAAHEVSGDGGTARLGEFLPEYVPRLSPAFTEWLEQQRMYVQAGVRRALLAAIHDAKMSGRWVDVEVLARRCLELDPLNEEATLALAEAAAMSGAKAQALQILDAFMSELGPGAKEIRLPAAILRKRIAERLPFPRYAAGETAFIGRAESMAVLAERLTQTRASQGGAVLVWGDAGLGKTRLSQEFERLATLQGVQVQRHKCQPNDPGRPLSLFVDTTSQLLTLPGALGCSPRSLTYLKRLTEHELDAVQPSEETRAAEYLYASVRQSLFDLVDAVSSEAPLLVVVEDVHWLDRMSWQVLREMIEWAATHTVLFLLTSQTPGVTPEGRMELPRGFERHRLPRLDPGASAELVEALARAQPQQRVASAVRDWCVATGDGNPLYLRELLAHGLERGVGRGVPPTLATLIDERISRLSPTALRVFQASAILGNNSTLERLEALLERKAHELVEDLEELDGYGMLAGDPRRTICRHDLLIGAAFRRLSQTAAILLHRRVAAILEAELQDSPNATLMWECGDHWRLAGEEERAFELAMSCGAHLLAVGLPEDSSEVFQKTLPLARTTPSQIRVLSWRVIALRHAGHWRQVAETCDAITQLAPSENQLDPNHNDVELHSLDASWRNGSDLRDLLARALRCAISTTAQVQHRASAAVRALIFADNLGLSEAAIEVDRACAAIMRSPLVDAFTRARYLLIFHTTYGDLSRSPEYASELVQLSRERPLVEDLTYALRNAAFALKVAGDVEAALGCLFECYETAQRYSLAAEAACAAEYIAVRLIERDDLGGAHAWIERGRAWSQRCDNSITEFGLSMLDARLALMNGDTVPAEALARIDEQQLFGDSIIRRRSGATSILVWLRSIDRALPFESRHLLDLLTHDLLTLQSRGGADFVAFSLCRALSMESRSAARTRLVEYLEHRRDRCALPQYLVELSARLNAND